MARTDTDTVHLTGAQTREARMLLDWGLSDLARQSRLPRDTLRIFELTGRMRTPMFQRTDPVDRISIVRASLEAAGIEFDQNGSGPGVRLKETAG